MRTTRPTILCDADDGECGNWDLDYYAETVSRVNDTPITLDARAPGWDSTPGGDDFCPEHPPCQLGCGRRYHGGLDCRTAEEQGVG